jgi:Glycosyl hydrolases family 18
MVALLQAVREALDTYVNFLSPPYHFTLTAAFAGLYGYQYLNLSEMDQYVDFINFMAYDYTGSWSAIAGNQANLFPSSGIPESTPFNTETVINYISQSILLNKTVLGLPLYGRAFNNTNGLGQQFSGSRIYDVKDLPLSGCVEVNDDTTGSSHCYGHRELISYDSLPVVDQKAAFIRNKKLGGAMFWESSMDGTGDKSIVRYMAGAIGRKDGSGLDNTLNQLLYPDSPYDNILKCAPQPSPAPVSTTSRAQPSHASFSRTTSVTGASPTAGTTCTVGPAYYNYQGLLLCTCGIDVSGQPTPYNPAGLCYANNCDANNATLVCGKNRACIPDVCESGAYCAPVIEGCQNFPQATAIVLSSVPTGI